MVKASMKSLTFEATPLLVGLSIAGAAIAGRFAIQAVKRLRSGGMLKSIGSEAGFEPSMTSKEAALILGVSLVLQLPQSDVSKVFCYKRINQRGSSTNHATEPS